MQNERISELELHLRRLATEARGFLGCFEDELRRIAGNTNIAVLQKRVDEAFDILDKASQE